MPTRKGSDNIFPLVRLSYEDDTPDTPPSGQGHLVAGADKLLRWIDDEGVLYNLATPGAPAEITDSGTAETDTGLVLRPDGAGGVEWAAEAGGSGLTNALWKMGITGSSATLTNNTPTQVTFDNADIDSGSSVIDLANDRFVAPATGLYLAQATWLWEATAPAAGYNMSARVNGTDAASLVRGNGGTPGVNGGHNGSFPLSLTSGDFVTLFINPGAVTGVTARGNASVHLHTSFSLIRLT